MDLRDLLRELVKRHRNQTALAQAMGIDRSRISKILKGVEYPTLEVQNCLRLADVTGESPMEILTAAGKGDVADLIERLYGQAKPASETARLTHGERDHLNLWRSISAPEQQAFEVLIRTLHDGTRRELDLDPAVRDLVEMFSSLDEEQQALVIRSLQKLAGTQPGGVRRARVGPKTPPRRRADHGGTRGPS
jgi:plasmid maintenance system antidote protein VapI